MEKHMCAICDNQAVLHRLWKKAKQSPSQYRIACVAMNKKGEVIGYTTNKFRKDEINPVIGSGLHAEAFAMARYYPLGIKTLLIMRIGLSGDILPIDPCEDCQKMAKKLGVKIESVMPGTGAKKKKMFVK
jgi:cytidine deaminase